MKKKLTVCFLALFSISAFAQSLRLNSSEVNFNNIGNPDLKIEKAFLTVRCLRKATFFEQFGNGLKEYMTCDNFKINNVPQTLSSNKIEIVKDEFGQFQLDTVNINFSKRRKGHVCLALSVKFEGIPTYSSGELYVNYNDQFSLHSYCTVNELPVSINQYVYNNKRVQSLNAFTDGLERGIDVNLLP